MLVRVKAYWADPSPQQARHVVSRPARKTTTLCTYGMPRLLHQLGGFWAGSEVLSGSSWPNKEA
jgi:hypothetical protein